MSAYARAAALTDRPTDTLAILTAARELLDHHDVLIVPDILDLVSADYKLAWHVVQRMARAGEIERTGVRRPNGGAVEWRRTKSGGRPIRLRPSTDQEATTR